MKQIITVHDLICLKYPEQHPEQTLYFEKYLPYLLKNAVGIVTVSEHSRKEIVNKYMVKDDKICVIPCGYDESVFSLKGDNYQFECLKNKKYHFAPGMNYPHKNGIRMIEAFYNILNNSGSSMTGEYKLVVTGPEGEYKETLKEYSKKLKIDEKILFLGFVSKEELASLYRGAIAMVYPSKHEGFGIPVLESMACG